MCVCDPSAAEMGQEIPGARGPASLAYLVSSGNRETLLPQKCIAHLRDTQAFLLASMCGVHTCERVYTHTQNTFSFCDTNVTLQLWPVL